MSDSFDSFPQSVKDRYLIKYRRFSQVEGTEIGDRMQARVE